MLKEYEHVNDGMTKDEHKKKTKAMQKLLTVQQQRIAEAKLPIIVMLEGWSAAGKGWLLNELISELDPRFYSVFALNESHLKEKAFPFLAPFFKVIPENGQMLFMDAGWMEHCVRSYQSGEIDAHEYERRMRSVQHFEKTLVDNGYVLVKLFLHIGEKQQKKRLEELKSDPETSWRVSEADLKQNRNYDHYLDLYNDFMKKTEQYAHWNILDGSTHTSLLCEAFTVITETVERALAAGKYNAPPYTMAFPMGELPRLTNAQLSFTLDEEAYKTELKELQEKLRRLHTAIYLKKIPVVICYEGWDAAGKGGNIRRLTYPLDPRGFDVHPIAAPEPHELARHYLWRFWTRLPKFGHIAIFDRTWYGRVMVERIEGFCTENDWKRAYCEINEFERELVESGAVVLKFWIDIDSDTQLERFQARQNNPEKQWKITEEDWRNREKRPQYEEAVNEMFEKTSTQYAPWHVIESFDKKYARIKVLRIVVDTLERALKRN